MNIIENIPKAPTEEGKEGIRSRFINEMEQLEIINVKSLRQRRCSSGNKKKNLNKHNET